MTSNRTPPFSIEAEQSVLAAIMQYGKQEQVIRECLDMLSADMFYSTFHQNIFHAITTTTYTDPVAVADDMVQRGVINQSQFADVVSLSRAAYTKAGLLKLTEIIRERHAQRVVINLAENALAQMYAKESASDALAQLIEQANQIDTTSAYSPSHVAELVDEWVSLAEDRVKGVERVIGAKTGIDKLDDSIVGMGNNWLFILAGRPSHGKSLIAQWIGNSVSREGKVLFMSLEMTKREIMDRLIAMVANVSPSNVRKGLLETEEWARVSLLLGELKAGKYGLYFDDTPSLTVEQVCQRAKTFKRKHPECKLIQIDYLGLMQTPKSDRNDIGIGMITKRLKQLAKEIETPIMLLTQLNRAADQQDRPAMRNLADSASIERDADIVMFTHNLGVAHQDNPKAKGHWILSCGKFRHGEMPDDIYIKNDRNQLRTMEIDEIAQLDNFLNPPKSQTTKGFDV